MADKMRLSKSERDADSVQKRKAKGRVRAAAEESYRATEGPTYGAGQF